MPTLLPDDLTSFAQTFDINLNEYPVFVETGTYQGETMEQMQPLFPVIHTIEISKMYHERFLQRFSHFTNVTAHLGDSSKVLLDIVPNLTGKTVFWLDGHWSSGDTGRGEKDCPLAEELDIINEHYPFESSLIIIDDYHMFGTFVNEDWTEISEAMLLDHLPDFNKRHVVIGDRFIIYVERA